MEHQKHLIEIINSGAINCPVGRNGLNINPENYVTTRQVSLAHM